MEHNNEVLFQPFYCSILERTKFFAKYSTLNFLDLKKEVAITYANESETFLVEMKSNGGNEGSG